MSRKKRLSVGQIFKLVRLIIEAVGHCAGEVEKARAPGSPGGHKITPDEAAAIAVSSLSAVADDLAEMLQE